MINLEGMNLLSPFTTTFTLEVDGKAVSAVNVKDQESAESFFLSGNFDKLLHGHSYLIRPSTSVEEGLHNQIWYEAVDNGVIDGDEPYEIDVAFVAEANNIDLSAPEEDDHLGDEWPRN